MDEEELVLCGTNIFKQFSDWLRDYEFIATWLELIFFVSVFIFFEFRNKREERKEKRKEKTKKELCFLIWFVFHEFIKNYKTFLVKQDIRMLNLMIATDKETIKKICEDIAKKTFLPQSFCEEAIKNPIILMREQLIDGEINYFLFYDCLIESAKNIFIKDAVTPTFIEQIKIYFNSDKEIDEIYEKLKNI